MTNQEKTEMQLILKTLLEFDFDSKKFTDWLIDQHSAKVVDISKGWFFYNEFDIY